jgi:hypothetical protein
VRKFGSLRNPNYLFWKQQQKQQLIGFVLLRRSGHQTLLERLTNDSATPNFLQLVIKVLPMEGPGLVRISVRVRVRVLRAELWKCLQCLWWQDYFKTRMHVTEISS